MGPRTDLDRSEKFRLPPGFDPRTVRFRRILRFKIDDITRRFLGRPFSGLNNITADIYRVLTLDT